MNEELKPCPFCGGEAGKRLDEDNPKYWSVMCNKCHCKTSGYQDYTIAVSIWNTRLSVIKNTNMNNYNFDIGM